LRTWPGAARPDAALNLADEPGRREPSKDPLGGIEWHAEPLLQRFHAQSDARILQHAVDHPPDDSTAYDHVSSLLGHSTLPPPDPNVVKAREVPILTALNGGAVVALRAMAPTGSELWREPEDKLELMMLRLALVVMAAALALLPLDPLMVEHWYSTGIYPRIQRVLTPVSNAVPVAWLDVVIIASAAGICWLWWRALRTSGDPIWPRVRRAALTTATFAVVAYLVFLAIWGLNYRRLPMGSRVAVREQLPSTGEVVALGREAVARINSMHAPAHQRGWLEEPWRNESMRAAFADVQRQLADGPLSVPGRLKSTLFGVFFRWTAVDGMVNPFGLEVLANPDLLPFERPFVAAHEWAHLAGFADEAEASFVGWLTAVRADPAAQYSGWLYLYWHVAGELPADERRLVAGDLHQGPRADLAAIAARLRRGDLPLLRRATWMVYDSYLKANRVEEGVRSYGAVVNLILRARFEDGWRPVRRPSP